MMTTLTICLLIVLVCVIVLVALHKREHVTARLKLPGIDFSLEARDPKR
jgi:hypothetical protein